MLEWEKFRNQLLAVSGRGGLTPRLISGGASEAEPASDLFGDLLGARGDIDRDGPRRLLQRVELAAQQGRIHEVPPPPAEPLLYHLVVPLQVYEQDPPVYQQVLPVALLQRGAGEDGRFLLRSGDQELLIDYESKRRARTEGGDAPQCI